MLENSGNDTRVKIADDFLHGKAMTRMGVPNGIALKDARGTVVGNSIYRRGKTYYNIVWDGYPEGTPPTELSATFLQLA
jgi:hypothetical protein